MTTSLQGINLIKEFESFSATEYLCPAGLPTIGYGHVIRKGEKFTLPLTEADAESLLHQDLRPRELAVEDCVKVPLSQNQFDALISFVFNVGVGAFENSTLLTLLNMAAHPAVIGDEFLRWNKSKGKVLPGLARRRLAERELFLTA